MAEQSLPAVPDVSVIVIVYNDAERLPRAVDSVLTQTLRNLELIIVNDASTDETREIADELARQHERVRAVHLPENSGGCSRPRNVGLEHANAPFVMFLDSDDEYERHACKNLLLEAERTDAEVVSGRCVRVLPNGRIKKWFRWLYAERAVHNGIRSEPRLFYDPLSTNKLYRREFLDRNGIRFPEGIHYEDSLFSTKAYFHAQRIAIIPTVVYRWHVVEDVEGGDEDEEENENVSITSRRFEIGNFRDRIAIHRMIDEFLLANDAADLKVLKDAKFIRHDLRLYLNDLPARPAAYQREFMDLASDYLATVSEATLAEVQPIHRIAVMMMRKGDIEETLKVVDFIKHGYKLSTDLVERSDRIFWTAKYLDSPVDRAVLDVTSMGLHTAPFRQLSIFNRVTSLRVDGSRIHIEGELSNQLDRIQVDDKLTLAVSMRNRKRRRAKIVEVADVRHDGNRIRYRADFDAAELVGELEAPVPVWKISMRLTWKGEVNYSPFSIALEQLPPKPMSVRTDFGQRGEFEWFMTTWGNLALRLEGYKQRLPGRCQRAAKRAPKAVRARTEAVFGHQKLKRFAYHVLMRLPVKRGLVVFETHMGRGYSDSPKYIYEAARAVGFDRLGLTPVWSYSEGTGSFPPEAKLVRRLSWRYYWSLARAEFWVDNQGFPRQFARPSHTTYIQTWHGTPLKRMGFDAPELVWATEDQQREHAAMIQRWSCLLVPSEYFVETFVHSYRTKTPLIRIGLPRNDLLVRGVDDKWIAAQRRKLGLPSDRIIVLYAPTFRDRRRKLGQQRFQIPFNLRKLQEDFGNTHYFLVRSHYLEDVKIGWESAGFVQNVSGYPDVTELMLVSDLLVTDYSSIMFDYANLGRPMIFYTHDYEDYARDQRGTYFNLRDEAPGPLVEDTEGLGEALRSIDSVVADFKDRYEAFRKKFCTYESGMAGEDVVRQFFERGTG